MPALNLQLLNTRHRSARQHGFKDQVFEDIAITEPPCKKRRYAPSLPRRGERLVDPEGKEILGRGTASRESNYVSSRHQIVQENTASAMQPIQNERARRESRRERPSARPRFSSAAAAAAAVVQGDGFKPREERGWEEFHQDLDIEAKLPLFSADEVDGIAQNTGLQSQHEQGVNGLSTDWGLTSPAQENHVRDQHQSQGDNEVSSRHGESFDTPMGLESANTTPKRRPGRPPRRTDSMLKGIGTPDMPKIVPLPGPNPREKLTLPKPSFRALDPFSKYEQKGAGQLNYVDRSMANVGYQESDIYIRPDRVLIRMTEGNIEEDLDVMPGTKSEEGNSALGSGGVGTVEYDMDEQDTKWLESHNQQRKTEQVEIIKPAIFEITMTKIEKEWHALEKRIPKPNPKPPQTHRPRSSSAAAVNGEPPPPGEEQDSKCAICDDGDCENTNAIVFCDGCDLAVHQECYGVPFIPEGQWLCRKCQLIGRATPTCIFCPNIDGAFKQTNASRWSHLLCAIWIPEVSLGNNTFMEPVMDVEKVPRQRWKLTCYICRQKMGACIQCGNKNCFVAFHVTCARRAKLFLKMKSTHGGPASLDASVLKAFCDKHVPADWRRENDVAAATADAIEYYHYTMRGRLWADSQQAALTYSSNTGRTLEGGEEGSTPKINLIVNPPGKKRNQPPKTVWRLPSGAPVIPQVLFDSVESSLGRFTIRRRKEFAAEACKYWTLKREARRGASLLKRLQLQMETFTSMEMTRRNFVGMGAAGRVRLQRRIDFAEKLLDDLDRLKTLCGEVKKREQEKLQDAEMLKGIIDTVYFPIAPLLWPILERAEKLDNKKVFTKGFSLLRERLKNRYYTSVSIFSADFGAVFSKTIGLPVAADNAEIQAHVAGEALAKELVSEVKSKKALAKRIIKYVQGSLEDAMRKESELCQRPYERELRDLDLLLENSTRSRRDSLVEFFNEGVSENEKESQKSLDGLSSRAQSRDKVALPQNTSSSSSQAIAMTNGSAQRAGGHRLTPDAPGAAAVNGGSIRQALIEKEGSANALDFISTSDPKQEYQEPQTPSPGLFSQSQPLSHGGVPWYMEPFDPDGTTVHDERWTGRELVRGMSEELSDMDEDELSGLVDGERQDAEDDAVRVEAAAKTAARRKAAARRKRNRGW